MPENDHLSASTATTEILRGKAQCLGDFINTDASAPAEALGKIDIATEELGTYSLVYTHPNFRRRVKEEGLNTVMAGKAFGVGSSRENAATSLQGAGFKRVIAKSFAFIYGRNQPNLEMLGFVIEKPAFYNVAVDGAEIGVDLGKRVAEVARKTFTFQLSEMRGTSPNAAESLQRSRGGVKVCLM